MRMLSIRSAPCWEDPDGTRRPGLAPEPRTPRVGGWVNVAVIELRGEQHLFLLTGHA